MLSNLLWINENIFPLLLAGDDRRTDVSVQVNISPSDLTAHSGEGIRLNCSAIVPGDRNAPTIRWTRRGSSLPVNAQQNAGILVIPSASHADSGIYICTVTTSSGATQTSQARINVLAYR